MKFNNCNHTSSHHTNKETIYSERTHINDQRSFVGFTVGHNYPQFSSQNTSWKIDLKTKSLINKMNIKTIKVKRLHSIKLPRLYACPSKSFMSLLMHTVRNIENRQNPI